MKKINVLSLFDGISCGQVALQRANIEVENYYAYEIDQYSYEYLKKPVPIIVEDLSTYHDALGNILSIDGQQTVTNVNGQGSELDSSLHRTILKYAVQLASASWASNNKS